MNLSVVIMLLKHHKYTSKRGNDKALTGLFSVLRLQIVKRACCYCKRQQRSPSGRRVVAGSRCYWLYSL